MTTAFHAALHETREFLEASIDVTPADLLTKQAAKVRADAALSPLIELAHVWTGGAMLPLAQIDDSGYQALARAVALSASGDEVFLTHPRLEAMLAAGREGVPFELAFPEVFFPDGAQGPRRGFNVVVGNPPWDALQPLAKEFFAAFDLRVLDAPTRRERAEVEKRVQADPDIRTRYDAYTAGFEQRKHLMVRLYEHINRQAGGQPSGAVIDLWQPFAERALTRWTAPDGRVGLVLPSFREIARSTDERTGMFVLLPPGVVCNNKSPCERTPELHSSATALGFIALANTFVFDWALRGKVAATVNLFILHGCPIPKDVIKAPRGRFLAHAALRLTCNHAGYAPLWYEQLGDAWREPTPAHTWPVLDGEDTRWQVRATIDAVVADAYGLTRTQYEHLLSSFSHRSYPGALGMCLAAFDELQAISLGAFIRKYDPYADIPEVETLPEPVLDLRPKLATTPGDAGNQRKLDGSFESAQLGLLGAAAPSPPTAKKPRGRPRRT